MGAEKSSYGRSGSIKIGQSKDPWEVCMQHEKGKRRRTYSVGKYRDNDLPQQGGVRIEESIVVHRPVQEAYHFWRNLSNLPRFMKHLKELGFLKS